MKNKTKNSMKNCAVEILNSSEKVKFEIWANLNDEIVFSIPLTGNSWTQCDDKNEKLLFIANGKQGEIKSLLQEALYQNYSINYSDIEEENYPDDIKEYLDDVKLEIEAGLIQEMKEKYETFSK